MVSKFKINFRDFQLIIRYFKKYVSAVAPTTLPIMERIVSVIFQKCICTFMNIVIILIIKLKSCENMWYFSFIFLTKKPCLFFIEFNAFNLISFLHFHSYYHFSSVDIILNLCTYYFSHNIIIVYRPNIFFNTSSYLFVNVPNGFTLPSI